MNDYLTFRKMITPVFIQAIFWIAVVVIVIAGLIAMGSDSAGPLQGLLIIIAGPLAARIYAELFLVLFRIHDDVHELRRRGESRGPEAPPSIG